MRQEVTDQELARKAWQLRKLVLVMLAEAGSGHTASSLGLAEFMTVMYFGGVLRYKVDNPYWQERDRFIMSNGHAVPVWYAVLAMAGFIKKAELKSLRRLGSRLQGHPHTLYGQKKERDNLVPGIENSGGPLGQGVSVAVGKAWALRKQGRQAKVYCLLSDGELQEGQVWEALLWARQQRLTNLVLVVDRNNIQIDGYVEEIVGVEPLRAKFEAFGFKVREVDGHQVAELRRVLKREEEEMRVMIMKTVAGKGVSFMENKWQWHGKVPNKEELEKALEEIERRLKG